MDKMDKRFQCFIFIGIIYFTVLLGSTSGAVCQGGNKKTGRSCNRYNLAYNKQASMKDDYRTYQESISALDDNATSCSHTTVLDDPWWSVDMGKNVYVEGVQLDFGQETLTYLMTYSVQVQSDQNATWQTCYRYSSNSPSLLGTQHHTCNTRLEGRRVRVLVENQNGNLVLCTVGVYGGCVNGYYGDYCEHQCGHCDISRPVCDTSTGRCPIGCDFGWDGSTCKDPCPFKKYGVKCGKTCGECRNNQTCDVFDGMCPGGLCEIALKEPYCQQPCDGSTWGFGCEPCGACMNYGQCDLWSGICANKCAPGYVYYENITEDCLKECDPGMWGQDCAYECGKCYANSTTPGPCNHTDGECQFGCAMGYYESNDCKTECPIGTYGFDCVGVCGNCGRQLTEVEIFNRTDGVTVVPYTCSRADGSCYTGCIPGYQGQKCNDQCDAGTYGKDCANKCGQCMGTCDFLTAECPGDCKDGYTGSKCNIPCRRGVYGTKCQYTCPKNCVNSTCLNTDGSCVCADGWTGDKCENVCPGGHYGKDCKFPCGNCKPGSTCNQGDGYCAQGCAEEWTGLKCLDKVIIEVYEPYYGDIIGGTIGGAIGLGLIIAFTVWVVWRYRNDKSIHFRELASSLKRMSMRGSKNLRRSFQRLSMRNKRPATDQQKLGRQAAPPGAQQHQRSRANHSRMYECVQLQSNVIHFDDFTRLHLQLQETKSGGRTLLYDAFESFLAQRPRDPSVDENGFKTETNGFYNAAVDDVQVEFDNGKTNIPQFLPLGSNLSGFLLVNTGANSDVLWNHLQQRQIETIVSIGKECSFSWRPGQRMNIGNDIVDCVDVQLYGSHRETKLTVQRQGSQGRRSVRHLECLFCNAREPYPNIPTLLMFMDRFQQLHATQKERSILVNYMNLHDQAILFTLVASCLEIVHETKRVDILRTVAIGGKPTAKAIRTFEGFKYLHDVVFHSIASTENSVRATSI